MSTLSVRVPGVPSGAEVARSASCWGFHLPVAGRYRGGGRPQRLLARTGVLDRRVKVLSAGEVVAAGRERQRQIVLLPCDPVGDACLGRVCGRMADQQLIRPAGPDLRALGVA
jgi:hypothetical protein